MHVSISMKRRAGDEDLREYSKRFKPSETEEMSTIAQRKEMARRRRAFRKKTGLSPTLMYGPALRRTPVRSNIRVGGFMGIENKFKDFPSVDHTLVESWAGGEYDDPTAGCLSMAAQGDGPSDRDGKVFRINKILIRGYIYTTATESATAPTADHLVRLCLVQDKQTNGAQLNAEDVFVTQGVSGEDVNSVRQLENIKRFNVLKDKQYLIRNSYAVVNEGAVNQFARGRSMVPFKISYTFKVPMEVNCGSTTAVVANCRDNSLHLIGCVSALHGSTMGITYGCRFRFVG